VSSDRSGIGSPMPCAYGGETRRAFRRLRSDCFGASFWPLDRTAEASASSLTDESLDDIASIDSSSSWCLAISGRTSFLLRIALMSGLELGSISLSSHSSSTVSGSSTSDSKSATARQLGQRNWGQLLWSLRIGRMHL